MDSATTGRQIKNASIPGSANDNKCFAEDNANTLDADKHRTALPGRSQNNFLSFISEQACEFSPQRINRLYPLIRKRIKLDEIITIEIYKHPTILNALKADVLDIFLQEVSDGYYRSFSIQTTLKSCKNRDDAFLIALRFLTDRTIAPTLLYEKGYFGINFLENSLHNDQPLYLRLLLENARTQYGAKGEELLVVIYSFLCYYAISNTILDMFFNSDIFRSYSLEGSDFMSDGTFIFNKDYFLELNPEYELKEIPPEYQKSVDRHNKFIKKVYLINNALGEIFQKATGRKFHPGIEKNVYRKYLDSFLSLPNLPAELKVLCEAVKRLMDIEKFHEYISDFTDMDITYVEISNVFRFNWDPNDYGDVCFAEYNNACYEAEGAVQGFTGKTKLWPSYSNIKTDNEQNQYENEFIFIWNSLRQIQNHGITKKRIG